jgi:predicted ATPase/DNA-binding winged helix-turn-helix (wHTH) protein
MPPEQALSFGPYRLAGPHGPLWCRAQVVPVPPKALAVLWRLLTQAGQVVTKEALLEAVWSGTVVSEGVLTACVRTLRQALGEDAQQPHYIATVHRLGYRFVAPVTAGAAPSLETPPARAAPPASPPLVLGRAAELAQLHRCVAQARQGVRQTVFVTGEAGVGKTTVVDALVHQLASAEALGLGRGQCIEHYGAGEAYLPILEALGRWGREPGEAGLVACLRQYAPTWLAQLPALCRPDELAALQPTLLGATSARMLRELAEALEALAAERPLVLVLEDLHWSDPSTVEALALLARRRDPARLLVLGTYRPVELIVHDHPLKVVKQELVAHGLCVEIPLRGLSRPAVAAYVAQRWGALAGHEAMAAFVFQRTEGHPLFMVQVVDYLDQQHFLPGVVPSMTDRSEDTAIDPIVPQGLQDLLEAQLERLTATEQQVLEGGSVAGAEFVVASVAAGIQMAPEAVEAVCERLARQGQFLEERGLAEWPDGTVSGRYAFRHTLYQEVVYQRLGAGRRARVHRLIGGSEEAGYGARAGERAAALAMHFARGRDAQRAVPYLQQAATNALRHHAHREAIDHLTTALEIIHTLPDTPEHRRMELHVHLTLGPAVIVTQGPASPAVERVYARAQALCQQLGETAQLFPVLRGLWIWAAVGGKFHTAEALGQQLLAVAQEAQDTGHRLEAHRTLATTLFYLGAFTAASTHAQQGWALYDPQQHHALAFQYGQDPGVVCLVYAAWLLWYLGYPNQALARSQEALALARQLSHPHSLTLALHAAATLHQLRGAVRATQECAEAAYALATEHAYAFYQANSTVLQGWALAVQGHGAEGIAQMCQGIAAYEATGAGLRRTYFLALLAEAYGRAGQVTEGLGLLAQALTVVRTTGEQVYEAELYRLRGELLLAPAGPGRRTRGSHEADAESSLQQALAGARRQQAKSLELRAALSLAQLWQRQGKRDKAHELLAPTYGWFTEGFDTADLQEAKALLEALS